MDEFFQCGVITSDGTWYIEDNTKKVNEVRHELTLLKINKEHIPKS